MSALHPHEDLWFERAEGNGKAAWGEDRTGTAPDPVGQSVLL